MKILWKIVTGINGGWQRQISSGRNPIKAFDQSKPNSPPVRRMPSGVVLPFPRPHNYSTRSVSTQRYVQPALVSLNFSLVPSFVTPALLTCLQSGCLSAGSVSGHANFRLEFIRGDVWYWYRDESNDDEAEFRDIAGKIMVDCVQNLIQNLNNLFVDLKEGAIIIFVLI